MEYWNGLLEWTTGQTFFALKVIVMPSNEISSDYTLPPASVDGWALQPSVFLLLPCLFLGLLGM